MFAPDYSYDAEAEVPPFDRFVAVLWVGSEIAFDVFGMFFWSAIGLFVARALF